MFNICIYVNKTLWLKKLKYVKIIIKINYFKHIAKHTVYLVNFLSNIQLLTISIQEKI